MVVNSTQRWQNFSPKWEVFVTQKLSRLLIIENYSYLYYMCCGKERRKLFALISLSQWMRKRTTSKRENSSKWDRERKRKIILIATLPVCVLLLKHSMINYISNSATWAKCVCFRSFSQNDWMGWNDAEESWEQNHGLKNTLGSH